MKAGRRVHLGTLKDQNEMMVVKKCIKFWNFRSGLILRGFAVHGTSSSDDGNAGEGK